MEPIKKQAIKCLVKEQIHDFKGFIKWALHYGWPTMIFAIVGAVLVLTGTLELGLEATLGEAVVLSGVLFGFIGVIVNVLGGLGYWRYLDKLEELRAKGKC